MVQAELIARETLIRETLIKETLIWEKRGRVPDKALAFGAR